MPQISILLSTYNGSKYINDQIESLYNQTYKDFGILARDDGSSDDTLKILKSYDIKVLESGQNLGAKQSFAKLLNYAIANSDSDYFMFCDQDDVWKSDKIEKTLAKMQQMKRQYGDMPILIHTDLEVVDENLNIISTSFMNFQKINPMKNEINNLLIQNIIVGCTVMINRRLSQISLPLPPEAIMHDWWMGLVASKFGKIGYLDERVVKYRQHTSNTIGAEGFDTGFVLKNISKKASLVENISQATAFLKQFKYELDEKAIKMLEEFTTLEEKSWWQKRTTLWKYRLLKQDFIRNVGLFFKI